VIGPELQVNVGATIWRDRLTSKECPFWLYLFCASGLNRKFDAKFEGQFQSFHPCEERGQYVITDENLFLKTGLKFNLQKSFLTALKTFY
jgi:hypothetical protein